MEIKRSTREKAVRHRKARGKWAQRANEILHTFEKWRENEDVDAAEVAFKSHDEMMKVYDGLRNQIKKQKLPLKVTVSKKDVTLFIYIPLET